MIETVVMIMFISVFSLASSVLYMNCTSATCSVSRHVCKSNLINQFCVPEDYINSVVLDNGLAHSAVWYSSISAAAPGGCIVVLHPL